MPDRRRFLALASLGTVAVVGGCNGRASNPQPPSSTSGAAGGRLPGPRPLLATVPADAPVLTWTPAHDELVYTFGGAAPKHRITSGTRIVAWTEDCFDGAVKTADDLPTKVMTPGHDNPQTGPFFIEGAEPGDTVAVHVLKLEPARDYAVSSAGPGFGALVGTDRTAMLAPDLPETTWRYDVDAAHGVARARAQEGGHEWEIPLAPFLGCLGVAPAMSEVRSTIVP
jgi:acetamidase/formamidase